MHTKNKKIEEILPFFGIAAVIVLLILYAIFDFSADPTEMLNEAVSMILLFLLMPFTLKKSAEQRHSGLYLVIRTMIFLLAVKLFTCPVADYLEKKTFTVGYLVCSFLCVMSTGLLLISLCGDFLFRKKITSPVMHIMTAVHFVLLFIFAMAFYKRYIIYISCLPASLSLILREYSLREEVKSDET